MPVGTATRDPLHVTAQKDTVPDSGDSSDSNKPDEDLETFYERMRRYDVHFIVKPDLPTLPTFHLVKENFVKDREGEVDDEGIFFDHDIAEISDDLRQEVVKKALYLEVLYTNGERVVGQASFKQNSLASLAAPVTALHNTTPEQRGLEVQAANLYSPHTKYPYPLFPILSDNVVRDVTVPSSQEETWNCVDIGFGKSYTDYLLLEERTPEICLDWVPDTFQLKKR